MCYALYGDSLVHVFDVFLCVYVVAQDEEFLSADSVDALLDRFLEYEGGTYVGPNRSRTCDSGTPDTYCLEFAEVPNGVCTVRAAHYAVWSV